MQATLLRLNVEKILFSLILRFNKATSYSIELTTSRTPLLQIGFTPERLCFSIEEQDRDKIDVHDVLLLRVIYQADV